jgi:HEAT repeat protein
MNSLNMVLLGSWLVLSASAAGAWSGQASPPPESAAAVESLLESLKSPDPGVRAASARALGEIASEARQAIPAIGLALRDPDVVVRENAARALGQIGPAAHATVPGLLESLRDVNPRVRKAAALALGRIGDAGAEEALKLARKDPDKGVRDAVKVALKNLKNRRRP